MQVLKSGEKRKLSMKSLQNSNQKVPLDLIFFLSCWYSQYKSYHMLENVKHKYNISISPSSKKMAPQEGFDPPAGG